MSTVTFPYATMDQALQDDFAKIGGRQGAFSLMSNGFKQGYWRKLSNEKQQDKIKKALKLYVEYQKKQGGDVADLRLARASK